MTPPNNPYLDSSLKPNRASGQAVGFDCSRISGLFGGALSLRAMMESRAREAIR